MNQKKASRFKFSIKLGPTEDVNGSTELKIRSKTKTGSRDQRSKSLRRSTTPNLMKRSNPMLAQTASKQLKAVKMANNEPKVKKPKTSRNWYLMWTKIENPNSTPIYIKRWVRLEESEAPNPPPADKLVKSEPKIYACKFEDCDKVFIDNGSLKKHLALHGEKLFDCPFETCGKKFVDKSKLKRHQLVHTGERPYGCEICGKKFSLDFNLRTHIRTHTGLKPYACKFYGCTKRFTQSSNLVAHEKTHSRSEDKPDCPLKPEKPDSKRSKTTDGISDGLENREHKKQSVFSNLEQDLIEKIQDEEMREFFRAELENLKQNVEFNGLGKVLLAKE